MKIKTFKCNNKTCNLPISYDEDALTPMGLNVKCPVCQNNHFLKIRISQPPPPVAVPAPVPAAIPAPVPAAIPVPVPLPVLPVEEDTFVDTFGYLLVQDGSQQKLTLKLGRNVLGRANQQVQPDLPIVTQDDRMSKRHCVVEVVQTAYGIKYHLYDIGHAEAKGSTNGTFLKNEVLCKRAADGKLLFSIAALDANAVFRIGNTQISLQMDSPHLFKVGAGGTIVL